MDREITTNNIQERIEQIVREGKRKNTPQYALKIHENKKRKEANTSIIKKSISKYKKYLKNGKKKRVNKLKVTKFAKNQKKVPKKRGF